MPRDHVRVIGDRRPRDARVVLRPKERVGDQRRPVEEEEFRDAALEAYDVAQALNIPLSFDDPVAYVRAFAERMPDAKPSVLLDIESGKPSEVGVINGSIPQQASKVGLSAPVNATLTRLVKAMENRLSTN